MPVTSSACFPSRVWASVHGVPSQEGPSEPIWVAEASCPRRRPFWGASCPCSPSLRSLHSSGREVGLTARGDTGESHCFLVLGKVRCNPVKILFLLGKDCCLCFFTGALVPFSLSRKHSETSCPVSSFPSPPCPLETCFGPHRT